MCRMLGRLDAVGASAEPWITGTESSLLRQSNAVAEQRQADGWGVGWFDASRALRVVRGTGAVYEPAERERFRDAARRASGTLVIAHIRRASNPMRLPHTRLIAVENSQPFDDGGVLFAHNGVVPFPRAARRKLGPLEEKVRGVNDSEILFWLLLRHLTAGAAPPEAFGRSVADLIDVWRDEGAPKSGPYTGLNVLLSRGPEELWAFCHYRGEHGGALLDRHRPYYDFAYVADAGRCLIGSEPLDPAITGWRDLRNGQFLHARSERGVVATHVGPIPLPLEAPSRA